MNSFHIKMIGSHILLGVSLMLSPVSYAQVGQLLWEDNFDSFNPQNWSIDIGDGCDQNICGWGNQELQWYAEANVYVAPVPGESGNSALVLEAKDESINGYAFTSGKVNSDKKVAIQYGMIETRVLVPDLDTGLWPAAWLLGTSTASWPAKGEIDMMEMGHSVQSRSEAGFPDAAINNYVGSNLIFYADAACSEGNPTCAASTAWQNDNAHVSDTPLSNRFVIYRTYWTDSTIRFTVEENGQEIDLYDQPFSITPESDEFQAPFYLLLNMAVGGLFTDALNNSQVTANKPAKMLIDYVRVYELDGQGTVTLGDYAIAEEGTFGVFTDDTPTNNKLVAGVSSDIYNWNTNSVSEGSLSPAEGNEVIAWQYNSANQWFGGSVQARQIRDMSLFDAGNLSFKIKIPENVSFKIGIADSYTNESWIEFPAWQSQYGLNRDGQWGQVSIPVSEIRGSLIALQAIKNHFMIASVDGDLPTAGFEFAIDDILWTGGGITPVPDADNDGVPDAQDQCASTEPGVEVDEQGCPIILLPDGIRLLDHQSIEFYVETASWADVHYRLNSAGQQNFRMSSNGSESTFVLNGLAEGDIIEFAFTYQANDGYVGTSDWNSFTFTQTQQNNTDSDNDGIIDADDQCPNTSSGATVDNAGCEVVVTPVDSDSDGVPDSSDSCPGTPLGQAVDSQGCAEISDELTGLTESQDGNSVTFFVNSNDWADVHYLLNSQGQQNFRMTYVGSRNEFVLSGLQAGDQIQYWFTYWTGSSQQDTEIATYVVSGSGSTNPTDSDNDGVNDEFDQCPNTSVGETVDSQGCPIMPNQDEVTIENGLLVAGAGSLKPGFTLYLFDNDTGTGTSHCEGDCALSWPPLLLEDNQASGVSGLSFITRNDGSRQVTYQSQPLYYYSGDSVAGDTSGQGVGGVWWTINFTTNGIVPLYDSSTLLEPATQFDRGDALVTRFSDRARDRHAKEDQFQAYDHYLSHYWIHRTARFQFEDYVANGGDRIDITYVTEWRLDFPHEFRAWYNGIGTVAQYHGNYGNIVIEEGPGTWDSNFNKISDSGDQYKYTLTIDDYKSLNWNAADGLQPLTVGQRMEFEPSQFLSGVPEGRDNYYGTTYLYIVGQGLVPWRTQGAWEDQSSEREDSYPIAMQARLGGGTTLPYMYTDEPDNHFMQMATNLSNINGQPFVLGRRLHHTHFGTGTHDELIENGIFEEQTNKLGNHYINHSCSNCHVRNGRAPVAEIGQPLDKWVFKIGAIDGSADPDWGKVLQPNNVNVPAGQEEGSVTIASWTENNGLRSPNYSFTGKTPARFSARLAPSLVGLGLLDAVSEDVILALADPDDLDGDGISGKANLIPDPETGQLRLGRFGYKAGTSSLRHQIAAALNTDIGVMTSLLPEPDCGANQTSCGNNNVELADDDFNNLLKYNALLGVRPQRNVDDASVIQGKAVFAQIGCNSCHVETLQTSQYAPLAELRNQTIHAYTDLLLHDMGPGLADNLSEGQASGSEWRTTALWGLGLSPCVTGGVINPTGMQGDEICTPEENYLHDGRARTLEEAILWHGGEAQASSTAFAGLNSSDKAALLSFLQSL